MKQKITNISIELFDKKGFSQTSIQDIVDALGVTKGTFYYYFSSKEQLLMDIHLDYITHLLDRQEKIIHQAGLTNKEKLNALIELLIYDIKDKGLSGRVFFREFRHLVNVNGDIIKEKRNQFRLNIEKVLQEGVRNGEFKQDLNVRIVALAVLGVTNYSYNWFNPEGAVDSVTLVKIYSEIILNGIIK